jgi:hypothetical protein
MTRRLLNLLTALSLLLCAAAVALGVRSFFVTDQFQRWTFGDHGNWTWWNQHVVTVGRGGVGVLSTSRPGPLHSWRDEVLAASGGHGPPWHTTGSPRYPRLLRSREVLGFRFTSFQPGRSGNRPATSYLEVVAPLWSVALPLAVLPALRAIGWWRERDSAARGLCPGCGYDLRATPGRCPECGYNEIGRASGVLPLCDVAQKDC